ncbi:protein MIS12 homolog [Pyrus x bretschneideri]|uniref:protein MIS12 homolog n=1 Tax=Pyrus x bretschneideri TaxID=225117 RepID=UPI0020303DBC|nr:protein MIS12 homolog [Pyrus x bretschneideri]
MEGSESEAAFNSLNLNPQLFINDVLNITDDLVDDAFDHFLQQASTSLKIEGTDRAQDLSRGVDIIRKKVQSDLDKKLGVWEQYCLDYVFQVPEGFDLSKNDELPVDACLCQNAIVDTDLDAQLDLLRNELTEVSKENAALNQEIQALEGQSVSRDRCSALVNGTLQQYDLNSYHEIFQEMVKTASELRMKVGKLQTEKMEESKRRKIAWINNAHRDPSVMEIRRGFYSAKLEDLEAFIAHMKNM